jgi:RyR domain
MRKRYTDWEVAAIAYAANTRLREVLGEEAHRDFRIIHESPERQEVLVNGVRRARAGVTPEHSHNGWCEDMRNAGWTWGPVEDPETKTHPNLVDYPDLPDEQKDKDRLFLLIVTALTVE